MSEGDGDGESKGEGGGGDDNQDNDTERIWLPPPAPPSTPTKRMPAACVSQVYIAIGQSNLASKTALMLRELPFGWALCRWGKRSLS